MSSFTWNVRVRSSDKGIATASVRFQQFDVGAPVEFDEASAHVSGLEYVLAAIGSELVNGLRIVARKRRVEIDHVEATVDGELDNALTYLGVVGEDGHPGLSVIRAKAYVSSLSPEDEIGNVWDEVLDRSPLVRTLRPVVELDLSWKIVL